MSNTFFESVYKIVEQIPYGRVISYGQIAQLLDVPRGARQVGWAMRRCPDTHPWWRVVMADGSISGGAHEKARRRLLEDEGVPFLSGGKVDVKKCLFRFTHPTGCDADKSCRPRTKKGATAADSG